MFQSGMFCATSPMRLQPLQQSKQFCYQMSDGLATLKYGHLRSELTRHEPPQIINRLIEQISVNEENSLHILRLQSRVSQLEAELTSLLASGQPLHSKAKQLQGSYQKRHSNDQSSSTKKQLDKWQHKAKELNQQATILTKQTTNMREEFKSKHEALLGSLTESTTTIQRLTYCNKSLSQQLQQALSDVTLLTNALEGLGKEVSQARLIEEHLSRENREMHKDCKLYIAEYEDSVQIIERLLSQLNELKDLHGEKSLMLKETSERKTYLELHLSHCVKEVEKYENIIRQNSRDQLRCFQEAEKLNQVRAEHQSVILALDRENAKLRDELELQIRNHSVKEELMKETKERNLLLEKKLITLQQTEPLLREALNIKDKELGDIKGVRDALSVGLEQKLLEMEQTNNAIRRQLALTTASMQAQIDSQLKTITDYERLKKPKVLGILKQKSKGQDKHKQFRLGQFQMKLQLEHSTLTEEVELHNGDQVRRSEGNQGLKSLVVSIQKKMNQLAGTYDALSQKTVGLTERIQSNSE